MGAQIIELCGHNTETMKRNIFHWAKPKDAAAAIIITDQAKSDKRFINQGTNYFQIMRYENLLVWCRRIGRYKENSHQISMFETFLRLNAFSSLHNEKIISNKRLRKVCADEVVLFSNAMHYFYVRAGLNVSLRWPSL